MNEFPERQPRSRSHRTVQRVGRKRASAPEPVFAGRGSNSEQREREIEKREREHKNSYFKKMQLLLYSLVNNQLWSFFFPLCLQETEHLVKVDF